MRKSNSKHSIKLLVIAGICLLSVGFANVVTSFLIGGNLSVTTNTLDVKFTSATASNGSSATITGDGHTIVFNGKQLTRLFDTITLDYEITNFSDNYDANVDVDIEFEDDTYDLYYNVSHVKNWLSENDGKILSGGDGTGKITISLDKSYASDQSANVDFMITLNTKAIEK